MTVAEAIAERRSIRSYIPREVEAEKLTAVLEAGRNSWRRRRLCWSPCDTGGECVMTCGQPGGTVDCSIALSFMMLQATELGNAFFIGGIKRKRGQARDGLLFT